MKDEPAPLDEFHAHEALHTIHIVRNMILMELQDHPYIEAYPELSRLIEQATDALGAAYNLVGEAHIVGFPKASHG